MKKFVLGIISGGAVVFVVLLLVGGIAVAGFSGQTIHAMGGKTGAEYSKVVGDLNTANGQIGDLQTQVGNLNGQIKDLNDQIGNLNGQVKTLNTQLDQWKGLLCSQSWSEATDLNMVGPVNSSDGSVGKVFNFLGFNVYATQWKDTFNANLPYEVLVKPLSGGIIFNVTKGCIILKTAVGPSA